MKSLIRIAVLACIAVGCKENPEKQNAEVESIFPKGESGPAANFTGKAWNYGLVPSDSMYNTLVGNVYFEPGARSNWHTHPGGQILIITEI